MEEKQVNWRTLGDRIADMRLSRGLIQFQLAELTGHSRVFIGYIEQGKRGGTILTYLEIVSALGYTLNDLVRENWPDPVLDLVSDLNFALGDCSKNEQESIVRIFRELLHMIRMIRKEDPDQV